MPIFRTVVLILLISFATLSAVLYTPGLPELAKEFSLSETDVQWTMSIFLLGYCIGVLPYGPLANSIGRKKTIYIGFALSFIGCAIVFFAHNFSLICLGRFIQAFGSSAGLKVAFTIIGDLHVGKKATKAIGYIAVAFAIVSGLGIAAGGFITTSFGWRGCFGALLLYTVVLFLCCLTLPETLKQPKPGALKLQNIVQGLFQQFKNPFILLSALLIGLASGSTYIFATEGPAIAINNLKMPPAQFGLFNLLPALGMAFGVIGAARFAEKIKPSVGMLLGILTFVVATLILALLSYKREISPWTLFTLMGVAFFGAWFLWVNASSMGLSHASDKSNASAAIQFTNVGCATLSTFLVGTVGHSATLILPTSFGVVALLMCLVWLSLVFCLRK